MHRLIVITGLDGTGTSTAGEHLAASLGARLIHTPAEPFRQVRGPIDRGPRDECPAAHYLFYLAALAHADATLIRPSLERGDVVCVRHLVDTVVSHRAAGLPVEVDYETPLFALRRPDRIFLLTVEEAVRRQRMAGRERCDHLDRALENEGLRGRFLEEFARLSGMLTRVDTTDLDPARLVTVLLAALETPP
jgi:thymidylate kinase